MWLIPALLERVGTHRKTTEGLIRDGVFFFCARERGGQMANFVFALSPGLATTHLPLFALAVHYLDEVCIA